VLLHGDLWVRRDFETADNHSFVQRRLGILAWIGVQDSHSFLIRHRILDIMKPSE
jgi:hypothetical protein